jgi:hypothetical protein
MNKILCLAFGLLFSAVAVADPAPCSVKSGCTGAATLTGYVKGNGTSPFTASSSVPTSDVSGTLGASQVGAAGSSQQVPYNNGSGIYTANSKFSTDGAGSISITSASNAHSWLTIYGVGASGQAAIKLDTDNGIGQEWQFSTLGSDAGLTLSAADNTGVFNINPPVSLGGSGSRTGTLAFIGITSGNAVTLAAGASTASYTLTFPSAAGSGGDCLKYGTPMTFGTCSTATGTVTSVATGTGLTGGTITTSGTLDLAAFPKSMVAATAMTNFGGF